mgnify:CR=1 FL=1
MKLIIKLSFEKDIGIIKDKVLKQALIEKIDQMDRAKNVCNITGVKLLRGYQTHYRIKVESENLKYRIGAIIRNDIIWLVRFLPRKKVYTIFP